MTSHVLDNPAWNAMNSSNSHLALGNERVKFFPEEVGLFGGLKNYDEPSFRELDDLIPPGRRVVIPINRELKIPAYWKIIDIVKVFQMIFNNPTSAPANDSRIIELKKEHIPQMIALTQLTHPGPFFKRTIEFGNYRGIFNSGELIAMAGQRMHANEYVEISAVCTHPDHTGKGYARSLINDQLEKILKEGDVPFLHVRADNKNAVILYKRLGFSVRSNMNIYVLQEEN